jgi:hypothetical protein
MGRLTLNVLLSFAQFEREVTGERIRDKIAASKRKGMWMGGVVPLGYDVIERRLAVNPSEAKTVREIFPARIHRRPRSLGERAAAAETAHGPSHLRRPLAELVRRVDLDDSGIRLSLALPVPAIERLPTSSADRLTIQRSFPLQIRRRGVEMRLVIQGNGPTTRATDLSLLKAVARAQRWSDDLLTGRMRSIAEIAERERLSARYVGKLMRLGFLTPRLVEMIAAGKQPPQLTAESWSSGSICRPVGPRKKRHLKAGVA